MNIPNGKISNPLTIIAIFAGLAEINGTIVIKLVPANLQSIFIWFIICFPTILVIAFFITLNFNPSVIYAPSDFSNEDNFLKTLLKGNLKFEEQQLDRVKVTPSSNNKSFTLSKPENTKFQTELFPPEGRELLNKVNLAWRQIQTLLKPLMTDGYILGLSYGIQAPEYFLLSYQFNAEKFKNLPDVSHQHNVIIRVTKEKDEIYLIAIGKNIVSNNEALFAQQLVTAILEQKARLEERNARFKESTPQPVE